MATKTGDGGKRSEEGTKKQVTRTSQPLPAVAHVDVALRQMHDVIADEALPDEFLKILADIDSKLATKGDVR